MIYYVDFKNYRTFQQAFWWSREKFGENVRISSTMNHTLLFLQEEHAVLCALHWV